jgi:hypothetical protein
MNLSSIQPTMATLFSRAERMKGKPFQDIGAVRDHKPKPNQSLGGQIRNQKPKPAEHVNHFGGPLPAQVANDSGLLNLGKFTSNDPLPAQIDRQHRGPMPRQNAGATASVASMFGTAATQVKVDFEA